MFLGIVSSTLQSKARSNGHIRDFFAISITQSLHKVCPQHKSKGVRIEKSKISKQTGHDK